MARSEGPAQEGAGVKSVNEFDNRNEHLRKVPRKTKPDSDKEDGSSTSAAQ